MVILYILDKTGFTVEAAKFLGISRGKLNNKRRVWGWKRED